MKSNTHKIKTIAVLWFRLYLHVKLEKQHNICVKFNWIKALLLSTARWERNWADAERERERGVCAARAGRETEQTQRERERCVRALGEQDLALERQYRWLGLGAFLKGKKSLKGSAMLLSWQHCASPFLQLRVGPRVKQKIRAALIAHLKKLVPLKWICVNALLMH